MEIITGSEGIAYSRRTVRDNVQFVTRIQPNSEATKSDSLDGYVRSLIGRNCLVVGPSGCGKMSLIRRLLGPDKRHRHQILFDFEQEDRMQRQLISEISARVQNNVEKETWILREIDALRDQSLHRLIQLLDRRASLTHTVLLATARRFTCHPKRLKMLEQLFPAQLRLPGVPGDAADLEPIANQILAQVSKRYGKPFERLKSSILEYLAIQEWDGNYRELRTVLERAVLLESTHQISLTSIKCSLSLTHSPVTAFT